MPPPFEDHLGRRIIAARMRRGVGQAELARRIGISTTTLLSIEKGRTKNPGVQILRNIARVLRVSPGYLLELTDDMDSDELLAALTLAPPYDRAASVPDVTEHEVGV